MEFEQSAEAKAKNVCHTYQECIKMYEAIPEHTKLPVLLFLQGELDGNRNDIIEAIEADPYNWIAPHHFFWGMGIRNLLRQAGYGEEYFGVHNLDDIYVELIEESLLGKTYHFKDRTDD